MAADRVDERGRRRLWLTAVVILAVVGGAGWLLVAADAWATGDWEDVDLTLLIANLSWVVAALIAIGLFVTRRRGPRSTVPSASAAREADPAGRRDDDPAGRLRTFLDAVDRAPTDQVRMLAVRPSDAEAHDEARTRALEAARFSGRMALVEESRSAVVEWLHRALGTGSFDPTFVGLAWRHEPLRIEDRGLLAVALEDAALATIVADLVDEATADELIGPCAGLLGGTGETPAADGDADGR